MWALSQKQKKKQLTTCHSNEYNGGFILYIEDIKLSDMKILAPPYHKLLFLSVFIKQGITNTLALPIDMMLYIYLLCPHSQHPKKSVSI
jgi:hypothetical protein